MIQRTDLRQSSSAVTSTSQDDPESWGQWSGRKHYSLEVVQHPLRARMCGFGDKDRRPLAPAAVAKMVVRRDDDSIVDVDEVDCSFFLVTVDLWSADGKHEMNLVLHPSSADRYVPARSSSKSKRRGGGTAPTGDQTSNSTPPLNAHAPYRNQFPSQPPADHTAYPQGTAYGPPPSATWGYPPQVPPMDRSTSFPPPTLPSIHSFARTTSTAPSENWPSEPESEPALPYRAWNTDTACASAEANVDPTLRTPSSSNPEGRETSAWPPSNAYNSNPDSDQNAYGPHQPGQYPTYVQHPQPVPSSPAPSHVITSVPPLPRHTYTRTLVGPLSANGCRLLDEHRKPGIFFLFQDLSVRTEGSFRLRMRLMNVGAPPAPEIGAQRIHNDVSPVLAQTFTDQFTVFSAKRFPGVPDTTALSIAFGNQGQKLPLRNRHGSNKRRRRGDSESDDDSEA